MEARDRNSFLGLNVWDWNLDNELGATRKFCSVLPKDIVPQNGRLVIFKFRHSIFVCFCVLSLTDDICCEESGCRCFEPALLQNSVSFWNFYSRELQSSQCSSTSFPIPYAFREVNSASPQNTVITGSVSLFWLYMQQDNCSVAYRLLISGLLGQSIRGPAL